MRSPNFLSHWDLDSHPTTPTIQRVDIGACAAAQDTKAFKSLATVRLKQVLDCLVSSYRS